jgi:hypothetical protein
MVVDNFISDISPGLIHKYSFNKNLPDYVKYANFGNDPFRIFYFKILYVREF